MRFFIFLSILCLATHAHADDWKVSKFGSNSDLNESFSETRVSASGGLPDGLIAENAGAGDIKSAWYSDPTSRYAHGILGDAIEAGGLIVKANSGEIFKLKLPRTEVFEDRYPRLADLDGDDLTEVITIKSSLRLGAAVTIYGLEDGYLIEKATTEFHGLANRWLNIAGIADFTGSGMREIAFVRTPHIGGTLYFYQYDGGKFSGVGQIKGFSNHAIGSREMRLSAVADINGDGKFDIAVPSDNRRVLRMIGFIDGSPQELDAVRLSSPIEKAISALNGGEDLSFVVGTRDGSTFQITR